MGFCHRLLPTTGAGRDFIVGVGADFHVPRGISEISLFFYYAWRQNTWVSGPGIGDRNRHANLAGLGAGATRESL